MNRLILSLIFLIATHTACFSSVIDVEVSSEEDLNSRRKAIAEQYEECKRREGLQEYNADPIFQQETEKLRTEADDGMMDLAKAGYVEARIWRGKRELQPLEFHRDMILSSLKDAEENLNKKENGIKLKEVSKKLKEVSKLRRDLQDIYEHLCDSENDFNLLKEYRKNKVKVVHDMQYYQDNNICPFTLFDKDEEQEEHDELENPPSLATLQISPASAPITYDEVAIFKKSTQRVLNELIEVETVLLKSNAATEALHFIKLIRDHITQNDYLNSVDDRSDDFVKFIFNTIRESTDYSYATKPSFRAISHVRDALFSALIRLSDENVTSAEILMSLTNCLLTPSNKDDIHDTIDCVKAELQLIGEIRRYLCALNGPNDYAKLVHKKLHAAKDENKMRQYYMNDTDYDSWVFVDSLLEPANNRFFTLQTFFINASYNPYKNVIGSVMTGFMDFGRKHFTTTLADIEKYARNKNKSDCSYYVYVQPTVGKPVQTILISKDGPYSIRYHHVKSKLTIGYLQTYPYDTHANRWISNSSGHLVCDGENVIIKYARYDASEFVTPANRLHKDGFLNATSYSEEEKLLGYAHF
ncbi:MAG: hypothetical protein V4544_02495 [Pseudomonadota bacterium]